MSKVALVIVYNHPHVENVEVLERIYRDRFSDVFHLMPFYQGSAPNVIPVSGQSKYFSGRIAQGFDRYYREDYLHYFFIHDDLLLNPAINQENYADFFRLRQRACFLHSLESLPDKDGWPYCQICYEWAALKQPWRKVEYGLPAYEEAVKLLGRFGFTMKPMKYHQIRHNPLAAVCKRFVNSNVFYKLNIGLYDLRYPLVGGMADIVIVPARDIRKFCRYCKAFADSGLYVEAAIPTALTFCVDEIVEEKDLPLSGEFFYGDAWRIPDKHKGSLKALLADFPEDVAYMHPIKLSQWNTQI